MARGKASPKEKARPAGQKGKSATPCPQQIPAHPPDTSDSSVLPVIPPLPAIKVLPPHKRVKQKLEGETFCSRFATPHPLQRCLRHGVGGGLRELSRPYSWVVSTPQLEEHINLKETRALLEAIQVCNLKNVHLQLYTDSTTVFWYIKKWGGEVYP